MEHVYQSIPGWFDFQPVYTQAVTAAPGTARFVEIGCYKGKSTAFLAVEIINSGKNIQLDVVDNFILCTREEFEQNMQDAGLLEHINVVENYSYYAADRYADNSLDFIFLDAAHDYRGVYYDIAKWYPKLKTGGILAGHDLANADYPGVQQAVTEHFGTSYTEIPGDNNSSWLVVK